MHGWQVDILQHQEIKGCREEERAPGAAHKQPIRPKPSQKHLPSHHALPSPSFTFQALFIYFFGKGKLYLATDEHKRLTCHISRSYDPIRSWLGELT